MKLTKIIIFRWLLSAAAIILFFCMVGIALKIAGYGSAIYLLLGFAAMITAILLILPETVTWIGERVSRIFTSLIFPDDKFEKPGLSYRLAREYTNQLRYDEAIQEYRKLLRYYPNELEAYLELISVCSISGQEELGEKYKKQLNKRIPGKRTNEPDDHPKDV